MISVNLNTLRKQMGYSQEEVAEKIGVSRQAVAKWENGETVPDLDNTVALAELYGVSIDNLVNYQAKKEGLQIPPNGKHVFGSVNVGERGQIVIPKKARDIFNIKPGDSLLILGDEEQGLAMVKTEIFMELAKEILEKGGRFDEGNRDEQSDKEI